MLANDIHVTDNGDGTITVLTMATGPLTLYDPAGKPIVRKSIAAYGQPHRFGIARSHRWRAEAALRRSCQPDPGRRAGHAR